MPSSHPNPLPCHWVSALGAALDPRSGPRLAWLLVGAILARGRRTVTAWIRAAGLSDEYRPCYTTVAAAGARSDRVAARPAVDVVRPLVAEAPRLVLALDDTPTPRRGPHVQAAGVHHNPTPGPVGGPFVYGHVRVVLGVLAAHPAWGAIALPLLARLYVRPKDLPGIPADRRPGVPTKLALAVELVTWARAWLSRVGQPIRVAADEAYAKADVLKPLRAAGVTVVSRRRKDAALWDVPRPSRPGDRGRPRVYGDRRVDLAKRAGPRRGWSTGTFALYGTPVEKTFKSFVATWRPAGGAIRVVLVSEPRGWVAFFATDPTAAPADVLGCVADRFALEITFRDVKEVVGAGDQQVRRVAASVGSFHVCLWAFTLTEAWAWDRPADGLVGHRSTSPWDDASRRPSHADKRRAWRRELPAGEIRAALRPGQTDEEIQEAAERLLDLAA